MSNPIPDPGLTDVEAKALLNRMPSYPPGPVLSRAADKLRAALSAPGLGRVGDGLIHTRLARIAERCEAPDGYARPDDARVLRRLAAELAQPDGTLECPICHCEMRPGETCAHEGDHGVNHYSPVPRSPTQQSEGEGKSSGVEIVGTEVPGDPQNAAYSLPQWLSIYAARVERGEPVAATESDRALVPSVLIAAAGLLYGLPQFSAEPDSSTQQSVPEHSGEGPRCHGGGRLNAGFASEEDCPGCIDCEHSGVEKAVEVLARRDFECNLTGPLKKTWEEFCAWKDGEYADALRDRARETLAAIQPFLAQPEGDGVERDRAERAVHGLLHIAEDKLEEVAGLESELRELVEKAGPPLNLSDRAEGVAATRAGIADQLRDILAASPQPGGVEEGEDRETALGVYQAALGRIGADVREVLTGTGELLTSYPFGEKAALEAREALAQAGLLGWVRSQIAEDEGCLKRETDEEIRAEYNGSLEALNEVAKQIESRAAPTQPQLSDEDREKADRAAHRLEDQAVEIEEERPDPELQRELEEDAALLRRLASQQGDGQ